MPYLVSEVKRKRRTFQLEGEEDDDDFESELPEGREASDVVQERAKQAWKSSTVVSKLSNRVESLTKALTKFNIEIPEQLGLDPREDEEEDEEEKERVFEFKRKQSYTEKQVMAPSPTTTIDFTLKPLDYEDTNGRADSPTWHGMWWQQEVELEPLVIHNPERISARSDNQFEAMIRDAEAAPKGMSRSNPGRLKKPTGEKVAKNTAEMEFIVEKSGRRLRTRLAKPNSVGEPAYNKNSIRILKAGIQNDEILSYHEPQLTRAQNRTFILSLDRPLTPLKDPIPEFTEEVALDRLFDYIQDMAEMSFLDYFLISPEFPERQFWENLLSRRILVPESELDAKERKRWKSTVSLLFINMDSTEVTAWRGIADSLEASTLSDNEELWEKIVLTSALTGSIPWEGINWTREDSEKLLAVLELLSSVLRKYDAVVDSVAVKLDDDIMEGLVKASEREEELEIRLGARIRPFVLGVRTEAYTVPLGELVTEIMLNAFYGVERDAKGAVSQIVQESDDASVIESLRLLPVRTASQDEIEAARQEGALSFDISGYTAGSYNYATRIMVSRRQAEQLGSIGLDKKVSAFRTNLIEALQNYRQITMRSTFLEDLPLPDLSGFDPNSMLCEVARYIHRAKDPDIQGVLRQAVKLMPQFTVIQSRRSRAISQYMLYYALAEKLSLFKDGYLKPLEPEKKKKRSTPAATVTEPKPGTIPRGRALQQFIMTEVEEDEDEEDDAEVAIREENRETRLMRAAASIYNPNNTLSMYDRETAKRERKGQNAIINQGWFLKWTQYNAGIKRIWEDTLEEIEDYEQVWLNFLDNSNRLSTDRWPLQFVDADGEKKEVVLNAKQAVDSIPYVRDLRNSLNLVLTELHESFYSAISVRDVMKNQRQALPALPQKLSQPAPLILPRHPDTNVKQRALLVARNFLLYGYLLPSNFDSLAAALTLIQLIRLLQANSKQAVSAVELISTLLNPEFKPKTALKPGQQKRIACSIVASAITGTINRFKNKLYYASIQDIRIAGVLGVQIDYWRSPSESKNVIDDIRTSIVKGLVTHLLDNENDAIDRYNAAIRFTNQVIKERGHNPEILSGVNDEGFMDYLAEADYANLTLSELLPQISGGVIIYTPWLSIQKALKLYTASKKKVKIVEFCSFIESHAGEHIREHYMRTDCGAEIVIDVRADDIIRRETFNLMQKHSLIYHDEDYDSQAEAVVAYFNLNKSTVRLLDEVSADQKFKLSKTQRAAWERVLSSKENIDDSMLSLNKPQRKQFAAAVQIMTNSVLRELSIDSSDRLEQSRAAKEARPYTGYIFKHEKSTEEGTLTTAFTPVYPGYERQLSRMLKAVTEAERQGLHWLDVWKHQYRVMLFTRMRLRDGVWRPFGELKEPALNMEQLLNYGKTINEFEFVKSGFPEPPIRPVPGKSGVFSLFSGGSGRLQTQYELFMMFGRAMKLEPGLVMLSFFVPDAVNGRSLNLATFVEGMDFLVDSNMVETLAPQGVNAYMKSSSEQDVMRDMVKYIDNIMQLFTSAVEDIKENKVTDSVQRAATLFNKTADDPDLLNELEIGLEDALKAQELIHAVDYTVKQEPNVLVGGEVISLISSALRPQLQPTDKTNELKANFLSTIPIPVRRTKRKVAADTEPVQKEAEEEGTQAMEIEIPEEKEKAIVRQFMDIIQEEEELEKAISLL